MAQNLIASATVDISCPAEKAWEALTTPALIKQYLFGTEAVSDWTEGSSITYRGVWEGKPYEDKGVILKMEPPHRLVTSYWSPAFGLPDTPENYKTVTYEVAERGNDCTVTISQDNNATEDSRAHSEGNWKTVLAGMKKLLEK